MYQVSNLFLAITEEFECEGNITKYLTAYPDRIGPGAVWTIGIGTIEYPNGQAVQEGDTCTADQAWEYFQNDTAKYQDAVNRLVTAAIDQGKFDALCDFTYEEGIGALEESTLLKRVNANPADYDGITAAFLMWDEEKVNGKEEVVAGILRRRRSDAYLYQYGQNQATFFQEPA